MIKGRRRFTGTMAWGREQPFGYTGYRYDEISGTYFAQAREYHPQIGRFMAEDVHWNESNNIFGDDPDNDYMPCNEAIRQSMNISVYCMNNPIKYFDLKGADAGDAFTSMDKAAEDFGKTTNGKSIEENVEYGTYIYSWQEEEKIFGVISVTKTYYSYTEPFTNDDEKHAYFVNQDFPIPENSVLVAVGHTHGAWKAHIVDENGKDWNDVFSPRDKLSAESMKVPA